jgi:hypothetical protein
MANLGKEAEVRAATVTPVPNWRRVNFFIMAVLFRIGKTDIPCVRLSSTPGNCLMGTTGDYSVLPRRDKSIESVGS